MSLRTTPNEPPVTAHLLHFPELMATHHHSDSDSESSLSRSSAARSHGRRGSRLSGTLPVPFCRGGGARGTCCRPELCATEASVRCARAKPAGAFGSRSCRSRRVRDCADSHAWAAARCRHFFPVFSRFLRVFTASTRRFQRAPSRNPGPRNSRQGNQEGRTPPFVRHPRRSGKDHLVWQMLRRDAQQEPPEGPRLHGHRLGWNLQGADPHGGGIVALCPQRHAGVQRDLPAAPLRTT